MVKAGVVGILGMCAVGTIFLKRILWRRRNRDDNFQARNEAKPASVSHQPKDSIDNDEYTEQKVTISEGPRALIGNATELASSGAAVDATDSVQASGDASEGSQSDDLVHSGEQNDDSVNKERSLDQTWDLVFGVPASEVQSSPVAPLSSEEFEAKFGADSDFEMLRKKLVDGGKVVYLEAELAVELSIAFESRSSSMNFGDHIAFGTDIPDSGYGDTSFLRQNSGAAHMALPPLSMEAGLKDDESDRINADLAESGEVISPHERPHLEMSRSDADQLAKALEKVQDLAVECLPDLGKGSAANKFTEDAWADTEEEYTSAWGSSPDSFSDEFDLDGMIAMMEEFVEEGKPGNSHSRHWEVTNAVTLSH